MVVLKVARAVVKITVNGVVKAVAGLLADWVAVVHVVTPALVVVLGRVQRNVHICVLQVALQAVLERPEERLIR